MGPTVSPRQHIEKHGISWAAVAMALISAWGAYHASGESHSARADAQFVAAAAIGKVEEVEARLDSVVRVLKVHDRAFRRVRKHGTEIYEGPPEPPPEPHRGILGSIGHGIASLFGG